MEFSDFEAIGLNENEARAYMAILELGESLASRIAEKADIKRTTVYLALSNLKTRGLIGQAKKNGQMYYFAEDPKILEMIIKERNERFSRLMPEIMATANLIDRKPVMRYFEGPKLYQKAYEDILSHQKQDILAFLPGHKTLSNNKYFINKFNERRIALKIPMKTLFSGQYQDLELLARLKNINQIRISPKELKSNQIEIYIYGQSKVSIVSCLENFSVIIESRKIYDTVKAIFEAFWRGGNI